MNAFIDDHPHVYRIGPIRPGRWRAAPFTMKRGAADA